MKILQEPRNSTSSEWRLRIESLHDGGGGAHGVRPLGDEEAARAPEHDEDQQGKDDHFGDDAFLFHGASLKRTVDEIAGAVAHAVDAEEHHRQNGGEVERPAQGQGLAAQPLPKGEAPLESATAKSRITDKASTQKS